MFSSSEYAKDYRKNNVEKIKEYNSNPFKKRKDVMRIRTKKYELCLYRGGKCKRCGIKVSMDNLCIFDFHHLRDKSFNMAPFTRSMKELKEESKKCIVLCSNCHRLTEYDKEEEKFRLVKEMD